MIVASPFPRSSPHPAGVWIDVMRAAPPDGDERQSQDTVKVAQKVGYLAW